MLKTYPILKRTLLFIFIPIILISLGVFYKSGIGLPTLEGTLHIEGIDNKVLINRDSKGVVFIEGQTDHDVFFALGFAHAQDRLWQLEIQRRLAKGTLSEVLGADSVNQDAWMRTLGLYFSAEKSWELLSDDAKESLTAYKNGINTWITSTKSLPPEFALLGIKPALWKEVDSLAWIKVFSLNLSGNIRNEITNLLLSQIVNAEQARDLVDTYPENGPFTISYLNNDNYVMLAKMDEHQYQMESIYGIGGKFVGSNAWAISGKLSKNGNSILANDPHLGLQIPSLWYTASLKGDKIKASGMTLVGLPIIVFGKNKDITWGGTSMMADTQDLYLEQVNPEDQSEYRHNNEWKKFDFRTEKIKVNGGLFSTLGNEVEPVELKVRSTKNGPIISDVQGLFDQPISLKWTALQMKDTTYDSFFKLNYASDWGSFKQALSHHVSPVLNMLYADKEGNIGFIGAGKIPIRSKGSGGYPVPAWTSEYEWEGAIPNNLLPQAYNPKSGFIISANNKVIGSDYPYFISNDWAPSTRAERIEKLLDKNLQEGIPLTVDYMKKMQADNKDSSVKELIYILANHSSRSKKQSEALTYIKEWDGIMSEESVAASIFTSWAKHLRQNIYSDELKGNWNNLSKINWLKRTVSGISNERLLNTLTNSTLDWCNNINTLELQSCKTQISHSLDAAIIEISKLSGSDMSKWHWGNIHYTAYKHTPFSKVKVLDKFFERRISNGGAENVINVANSEFKHSKGYEQTFGASFRQIISLNENDFEHYYMNSTGQSGNLISPYYDNMIKPFRDVKFYQLSNTREYSHELTLINEH